MPNLQALYLSKYGSRVYIIHRRDSLRASKVMQRQAQDNPKIQVRSIVSQLHGRRRSRDILLQCRAQIWALAPATRCMQVIFSHEIVEANGDHDWIKSLHLKHTKNGQTQDLQVRWSPSLSQYSCPAEPCWCSQPQSRSSSCQAHGWVRPASKHSCCLPCAQLVRATSAHWWWT